MTTTEILREKVKQYIDQADERSLLVVEKILEKEQEDWWDTLPKEVKLSVKKAINEIDEDQGISDEQVRKCIRSGSKICKFVYKTRKK
jgi:hypothetical protein